jgi:hypothetical protein
MIVNCRKYLSKVVQVKNKIGTFVVKALFVLPLLVFGIWLLQLLYFPEARARKSAVPLKTAGGDIMFRKIWQETEPVSSGHFHMVDESIFQTSPYEPICRTCHGTYAHSKEKKVRSLLNFHEGFLACAVCHVRKNPADETFSFTWVDRETGKTSMAVEGEYGKFPAKIYPRKVAADGQETIIRPISEKAAREYLKYKDQFTPDQVAQAKAKLHEHISKKPILCIECHRKEGYVNFSELGFPQNRVDHLMSTEVATMIDKYETFYLPEVMDFGNQ